MQKRMFLSSLLALGLLTLTVSCGQQIGQADAAPGQQTPAGSAVPDLTGGWIGKTAPGFSLPDADSKTVDVGKIIGKKPVILIFYRGVW